MIDLGLAVASIVLLLGLLYIYVANYRSLRSPFSVGLIVFATLFLLENLAAMYFYVAMNDSNIGASVAIPMLVLNAAERSEEHTSELQSRPHLVCRLLLEKKKVPTSVRPGGKVAWGWVW